MRSLFLVRRKLSKTNRGGAPYKVFLPDYPNKLTFIFNEEKNT
jgi:hypothetical protein